ncbi:hypothetical protein MBLNU457_7840t1 [Dothideomycetes sp. NU457]
MDEDYAPPTDTTSTDGESATPRDTTTTDEDFATRKDTTTPREQSTLTKRQLSREDFTKFSQSLCQVALDAFHYTNNGYAGEYKLFHRLTRLRQKINIGGEERYIPMLIRSWEQAPTDAHIVLIDSHQSIDPVGLPAREASTFQWWSWAQSRPAGITFIAIDAKTSNLSVGRRVDDFHRDYYHWPHYVWNEKEHDKDASEVIFLLVQGKAEYVAIMPTHVWTQHTPGLYGRENLTAEAPPWTLPFMVHHKDIPEALTRLTQVGLKQQPTYINPTNDCAFHGWIVDTTDRPKLEPKPVAQMTYKSFEGTLRLFKALESAGLSVELNPCAPLVHDFYIRVQDHGLLRVELKEYSLQNLQGLFDQQSRRNPFEERRLWHVLLILVGEQVFCVTRDEVTRDTRQDKTWLQQHLFTDFTRVVRHIAEHAAQAKHQAISALRHIQPEDIYKGIAQYQVNIDIEGPDPLAGHREYQTSLPWLSHKINEQCARDGYGVCFTLGRGHPVADHVFVKYRWTPEEQQSFFRFSSLPVAMWSREIQNLLCIPLRFHDHSPNLSEFNSGSFVFHKRQYVLPCPAMRNFLVVGWLGGEEERYLLYLSTQTVLSTVSEGLTPLSVEDTSKGQKYFQRLKNEEIEITQPVWPSKTRARVSFTNRHLWTGSGKFPINHYAFRVDDGSLNKRLRGVLEGEGFTRLDQDEYPGENELFLRDDFRTTIRQLNQMAWDYGLRRFWRKSPGGKKDKNDVDDDE